MSIYYEPERREDNPLAYQAWLDSIYGDEEAWPAYDPDTDDDGDPAEDEQ